MKEENKDLITFSEAARIKGVKPQTIDDYTKRRRLEVVNTPAGKFLRRIDVENLQRKQGGRPSKSETLKTKNFLSELGSEIAKIKRPEEFYPKLFKLFYLTRKHFFKKNSFKETNTPPLWSNPNWMKNKKRIRRVLADYPMTWQQETFLGEIYLSRKYVEPLIQEFFNYCLLSEKMYEENFSVVQLKHDFISYSESILGLRVNERETELICSMFNENLSIFKEDLDIKSNPFTHCFNIVNLIVKDEKNLSRISTKKAKFIRILRVLQESGAISTRSDSKVIKKARIEKTNRKKNRLKQG